MVGSTASGSQQWGTLELAGLFPAFFDAAPDAILVVDDSGTIVLANDQTEDLFGYDRRALVGEKIEALVPEALRDEHVGHRDAYMDDPSSRPMGMGLDLEAVRRDGSRFPVEISLSPLRTDNGLLVMAAVRDVTERERAQRTFEQLLEGAPDAILLVNREGTIELVNEQLEDLFGYDRADLLGKKVEVLVPDAVSQEHVGHRDAYMADPTTRPMGVGLDLNGVRADGTEFPVEISLSPLETEDGLRVMAAVRNMTDRQETQVELRARAEQQSIVAAMGQKALEEETLDDLMTEIARRTVDTLRMDTCKILQLEPGGDRFRFRAGFGWDEAPVGNLWVEADRTTQAGAVLETDGPIAVEDYDDEERFDPDRLLAAQGIRSGISVAIPGAEGPWGVLGVHAGKPRSFHDHDVAFVQAMANTLGAAIDRAQSKRELESYARRLERSNEEWERFAHVVSHDLQEPIRMINSYLQMLASRYGNELGPDADEMIEFAVEGGQRMRDLVHGLLAYSRVDTQAAQPEPVDLDDVLDDVLADLTVQIEEQGAEVTYGDLPEVLGDRAQVSQVFRNLVSNALKFVPDERDPRVHVSAERADDAWVLRVEDNGIGIEPEYQEKVFTIFQRLHGHDAFDGEGIGLALCRKIIERHGGTIWVTSQPGEGSTFHLTLPASDREPPLELAEQTVPEPPDV